jgi:diguanylate cyclase (GGDEF)-like protein
MPQTTAPTPPSTPTRPGVRDVGAPRFATLRELLHRPAAAWALVFAAVVTAASWPWSVALLTGTAPSDDVRARGTGALVVGAVVWGGVECLRGSSPRHGPRRRVAWSAIGGGLLLWALGAAGAVAAGSSPVGGPGHGAGIEALQMAGALAMLAGTTMIPSDAAPSLERRIDLALVVSAVLVGLWAAALPLLLDGPPGTLARALTAMVGAAWIVAAASIAMRAAPHHRSELRGLVSGLSAGGIAMMLTSGTEPASHHTVAGLVADLLWLTMGFSLASSGRRLRRPWVDSPENRRAAERLHSALPAAATVAALALVAVAQRRDRTLDPVMMALGVLVVVLSGARGLLMHLHNRSLFSRLLDSAEELRLTSRRDALTGLGNRLALEERLGVALGHCSPPGTSVYFIDIDNFKQVNDSLGHDAGDELLQVLAGRLTEVMGADVFRVGGDEFVAVREDLDGRSSEAVAAAVVAALGPPVQIGAHRFPTGASVGLARSERRSDGRRQPDDPQLLLRRADLALYRAKELGRAQWAAYEPWLQERADRRLTLQQGLREAIEHREFEVFYQPVHELATGALVGAEALVRWVSPTFGVLLPHEFVPLADEAALMPTLGEVVLDTVLADMAGGGGGGLWVAINLSQDEVLHPTLARRLTGQLTACGVPPERLRVEVTERVVLDPTAREVLNGLARAGLGMTIEDFGSGPTSLRHLSSFRKLTLKMDRSFLGAAGRPRDDFTILAAMVELAHELGLTTAAEAITTPRQAEDLLGLGVDEGQGWHFGQAIRWSELIARDTAGTAP